MNSKRNKFAVFLACGVLLMILPFLLQPFGNSWVRIIDMVLLYIMLALGLNIVVGYAGLLDLGYVAFFRCWCLRVRPLGIATLTREFR
jgi:branched-chain amino acid transport system permease protein